VEQYSVADSDSQKIFVVEDDVELAEMLVTYFDAQGYSIATSPSGEDALHLMTADPPDVVVLDIRLPDIDGYEVCRQLRENRRTSHLPVIFLTERRKREDKLAGLELGAVDYVTKPFDIHELRLRIRNALRRADLRTLHNPITGLPEGMLVQEQLEALLQREQWGLVMVRIRGLRTFRDQYGFVAADDVIRAVSLMIANAMQEGNDTHRDDFVGHTDAFDFVVITERDNCQELAERCRKRLQPSVQYFYPVIDRQRVNRLSESERLTLEVGCISSEDGQFHKLSDLGKSLNHLFSE
jgi:DNA-binding response OmpR family regulator